MQTKVLMAVRSVTGACSLHKQLRVLLGEMAPLVRPLFRKLCGVVWSLEIGIRVEFSFLQKVSRFV